MNIINNYYHWLHGQWPDRTVEKQPLVNADGTTNIKGVYVVGDLTGIPLLKFSSDTGAKAIRTIIADTTFSTRTQTADVVDIIVIGGGVSGYSAAIEGKKQQLNVTLLEGNKPFSTIENFPNNKPIYTYPTDMKPEGELQFSNKVSHKENLLSELKEQITAHSIEAKLAQVSHVNKEGNKLRVTLENGDSLVAHRVIVAIGRSGNYRKLNVEGEDLPKVANRFIDAQYYKDKELLIVGGGDSALEAAIATAEEGAKVTLSYRQTQFNRARPENVEQVTQLAKDDKVTLKMATQVSKISPRSVQLKNKDGTDEILDNDSVLLATGREAPLDFFRRSKINISGESTWSGWAFFALFLVALTALYDWKGYGFLNSFWSTFSYPDQMPTLIAGFGEWWQLQVNDRSTLIGTIAVSLKSRSFYYTVLYTLLIGIFGWQRIKRRKTPYVTVQTSVLFAIQLFPLFLLPEIILPLLGYNGVFDAGIGKSFADALFPSYISAQELATHTWPEWGHPRAYWHAYSFIFAWPLGVYTVFTDTPQVAWLVIGAIQTFVIIPIIVMKWGKGAYCSWICSCGAMAETMGDQQRHKMPHGSKWNKLNMLGQFILLIAAVLLVIRVLGWIYPESWMNHMFNLFLKGENKDYQLVNAFSYKWVVDILLAGILGFGLYFKYSGRTWCRFACPLAALMHIYSRFGRFAIVSEKSKCISCNQCTTVCHQGIDVMAFASKGQPMTDPQCVRCSACVQTCPTGTLSFAEINRKTSAIIKKDTLAASPVQMSEKSRGGVNIIEIKNV
ncbi:4Fe-4S binding protein [Pseudoalteromonas fuliginea]|uniref:4Fe-4S binding protein n=3 Tax=Pseudoalteromonas TaxID=53246 RepID=A0AB73BCY1_9GAMM|nr:NAD(P)-binding domain-containing protein [Pseudoalteromonas fuliginea]KAA1157430.1 4Fe-4S binding protein [Pseudoalteromonas fuliginea]